MLLSDLIVLTSPEWVDAGLSIAACRAGARGFLDLEYATQEQAREALEQLERHTTTFYGIKVGPCSSSYLPDLFPNAPHRLAWVIVAGGDYDDLPSLLVQIRDHGA